MNKIIKILIAVAIILIIGIGAYWYLFMRISTTTIGTATVPKPTSTVFSPINRPVSTTAPTPTNKPVATTTPTATPTPIVKLPTLRILSSTPVGGFGTMTSASGTVVRWIDRGRGNVYEANSYNLDITTISNTLLPRVYTSLWNKNLLSFVGQYTDEDNKVVTVITNIIKRAVATPTASSTAQNQQVLETAYELKGKVVSGNIIAVVSSPKKDKILIINNENNRAIGYISNFDGSKQTQLFNLPFSQIVAEWPEDNTIAITTKAGAMYSGYLYFINVKTGTVKEILGNISGLTTKVSTNATKVLYSNATGNSDMIQTGIYDVKTQKSKNMVFRTLADKCVWSNKIKEQAYCGVSSKINDGIYPDDWYTGKKSFTDDIWLLDSNTNEARRIINVLTERNALVDIFNLQIDSNDDYLFFMNKNDLSLWSLDLVSSI